VLAYSKIWLSGELIDSDVPEDPYLSAELRRYFPEALRKRFARDIDQHRLRRELIVTATTNSLVNRMGPVFAWRAIEETGASIGQIARAYTIAREAFSMRDTWRAVEALDSKVPASAQYLAYDQTARSLRHLSYWLLTHRRRNLHVERTVAEFGPGVHELGASLPGVATGLVVEHNAARIAQLRDAGLPSTLAERIGVLESMEPAFDLIELAAENRIAVREAARAYYSIGAATGLDWIRTQIGDLAVSGPWQASARSAPAARRCAAAQLESIASWLRSCCAPPGGGAVRRTIRSPPGSPRRATTTHNGCACSPTCVRANIPISRHCQSGSRRSASWPIDADLADRHDVRAAPRVGSSARHGGDTAAGARRSARGGRRLGCRNARRGGTLRSALARTGRLHAPGARGLSCRATAQSRHCREPR
jgi:hypothetical protein